MKGWREKDGFHIVFEGDEGSNLSVLLGEGVKAIKAWDLKDKKLQAKCNKDADDLYRKIATMFISDNYRQPEGGTSKENPVIA